MQPVLSEQQLVNAVIRAIKFNKGDFAVSGAGSRNLNVSLLRGRTSGVAATSCPFAATITPDGFLRMLRPGKLEPAGMPTNMFDGTSMFSGELTSDIMFLVGVGATNGVAVTSWELQLRTTPAEPQVPTEGTAPSTFEFDIYAALNMATLVRVIDCGNVAAAPAVFLTTDNPAPGCGINPLVNHYVWELTTV
jgi:hypothetical protein